jgi:hypothetical protein
VISSFLMEGMGLLLDCLQCILVPHFEDGEGIRRLLKLVLSPCSLGLSATSQQYFSLRINQPPATSQQYFSLRTNQHQPSATSQPNRLYISTQNLNFRNTSITERTCAYSYMIYIYTIKITRVGHKGPGGHQWPAGGRRCSASRTSARPLCPHARTRWCAGGSDDGRDGRAAAGPRRNNPARACDCVSLFLIQGQGGGGSPPLRCRLSSCTPYSDRRGGAEGGGGTP